MKPLTLLVILHALAWSGPITADQREANRMLACSHAETSILEALHMPNADVFDACMATGLSDVEQDCELIANECGY